VRELNCDAAAALLPELALGTLDGRDRADALDHLAGCPDCQEELRRHTEVADQLLDLVPAAEPPAGFEMRVLGSIGAERTANPSAPARRRRSRPVLAGAAAVLAVAVGLAGYGLGHRGGGSEPLRRATLTAAGHPVGAAYFYSGDHPWVYMGLVLGTGQGTITCELVHDGHPVATVGSFTLTAGHGEWGSRAPLPVSGVTGAVLVDANGTTVAQGTFGS
jgi:hypothetical protein